MKKNITDVLNYKTSLDHNKSIIDDLEREASFNRGLYYYNQHSYLIFEGKVTFFVKASTSISGWKSTGSYSNDHNDTYPHLKSVANSNSVPKLLIENSRFCVNFKGNYVKQDKISYLHGSVVNIYIVYSLKNRTVNNPDFTVQNGLFGAIKITKNVNTSNYSYSGYGICFDRNSSFSIGNINKGKNVIIFGCDMSSSIHANNKANNIYALGKYFIQGINGTTIYAERNYKINFTASDKKFILSLHYNGDNSYSFVNGVQKLKFKTKNSEIKIEILNLGNISKDWSITNATKTGLYGNVYDFAVDYIPINAVKTIYDIHRYLMKKHDI